MAQFKKALEALTLPKADGDGLRKIVFIVDELDRCRPDYALSLLEIIKHFFAVSNVHFVLGVNLKALENSVKARYGSEIDAGKYLQKFVMLTMSIPKGLIANPDVNAAMSYFSEMAPMFIQSANLANSFAQCLSRPITHHGASLRDIQRLLTYLALFPKRFENLGLGYQTILIGALYVKVLHPSGYLQPRAQSITLKQIADYLSLEKPQNEDSFSAEYRDWAIWAFAIEGQNVLKATGFPTHYAAEIPRAFGSYGHGFRWQTAQALIVEYLEGFTMPSS